jgi:hypothetical protein
MLWFGAALVLALREHVFEGRSPGGGAGARKGTTAAEETTALVATSDDLVLAAGDLREGRHPSTGGCASSGA